LNSAPGAAFGLCQLRSSPLLGKTVPSAGKSCSYPFSESLIVLMESGLEVCHDGLQVVSALGFASLVAEFEDSIVQPPLRHTHRRTILPTDRRYVRYRTYCNFEGSRASLVSRLLFGAMQPHPLLLPGKHLTCSEKAGEFYDPKVEIGPVPFVLTQERSKNGEAAESWDLRNPQSRRSS